MAQNIVAVIFDVESEGNQAFSELKQNPISIWSHFKPNSNLNRQESEKAGPICRSCFLAVEKRFISFPLPQTFCANPEYGGVP